MEGRGGQAQESVDDTRDAASILLDSEALVSEVEGEAEVTPFGGDIAQTGERVGAKGLVATIGGPHSDGLKEALGVGEVPLRLQRPGAERITPVQLQGVAGLLEPVTGGVKVVRCLDEIACALVDPADGEVDLAEA